MDLLACLEEQGLRLSQLRQDDLDRWLDAHGSQRRNLVRYFLRWTSERGLTGKLTVPVLPRTQPADLLGYDERWQLLRRCLTEEALPVDVRAAGALVLLFGLPSERIRNQHTCLAAGPNPIPLPPRLAGVLQRLATQPAERLRIPTASGDPAGCSLTESPANRSPTTP